ncbi:MAG TPA: MerR family transcriptional regulator, partial [Polyangiaceae bacterium]|nr:MerR family transcriptional regulator [Polyangiaceae bacterium]
MTAAALRPAEPWPYKMRDLCRLTGMPRQAIHFYIQQGLVPAGRKTGRNTARYGEHHVERIRVVRQLQNERFMPLRAIRAVLDGKDDAFTPEQRGVLLDVKQRLSTSLARPRAKARSLDARPLLARLGLDRADLDDLARARLLEVT